MELAQLGLSVLQGQLVQRVRSERLELLALPESPDPLVQLALRA